jgi:helicase MOV-10
MIIISTVRSNEEYLEHDKTFALGFLSDEKRLNVALTRAQAGLIVVGNPEILALDPLWRKFLLYVYDNGGWAGQDWDADSYRDEGVDPARRAREEMEAFVKRFAELGLFGGAGGGGRSGDLSDGEEYEFA